MNKENKKVVDSSKQEQLTMVDNIVISNAETGHKRLVFTTMIINTIKSDKFVMKYKDKTTNLEYDFNINYIYSLYFWDVFDAERYYVIRPFFCSFKFGTCIYCLYYSNSRVLYYYHSY